MASLHFYYATMNAGKSTNLIQSAYNYMERGMKTYVIKPSIDTREGKAVVKSRIGSEMECELFDSEADIFGMVSEYTGLNGEIAALLVDEAQFLTKDQVFQLGRIVDVLDIPVMAYGLRSDFQGNLFPGSGALFAIANRLVELKTICWCGKAANMVLRLDENGKAIKEGNQIQIGGNESYLGVCRKHFCLGSPFPPLI